LAGLEKWDSDEENYDQGTVSRLDDCEDEEHTSKKKLSLLKQQKSECEGVEQNRPK